MGEVLLLCANRWVVAIAEKDDNENSRHKAWCLSGPWGVCQAINCGVLSYGNPLVGTAGSAGFKCRENEESFLSYFMNKSPTVMCLENIKTVVYYANLESTLEHVHRTHHHRKPLSPSLSLYNA